MNYFHFGNLILVKQSLYSYLHKLKSIPQLYLHLEALIELYNELMTDFLEIEKTDLSVNKKGVAHSKSENVSKIIAHKKRTYKETLEDQGENQSVRTASTLKIFNHFEDDPTYTATTISILVSLGIKDLVLEQGFPEDKYLAIKDSSSFINASTPLKVEDFYESFAISVFGLYRKDGIFMKTIKEPVKHLPFSKLCTAIKHLVYELWEVDISDDPRSFKRPTQVRSFYQEIPILEYKTERNEKFNIYEEPDFQHIIQNAMQEIFSDAELLKILTEKIKTANSQEEILRILAPYMKKSI